MVHSECTIPIPPKETVGKPKTTLNFPWVFYTSRFREESQYKYSFQLPVMKSSRLFFWAPSVFPGALETRPGAGTLHVQGPGSSMQDGSQPNGAMQVTVGDRDVLQSQQPSMWCSTGISGETNSPDFEQIEARNHGDTVGFRAGPKENKPKMKLPLGQRVTF